MDKSCLWVEDEDGVYQTGCKNEFVFIYAGPFENNFKYCPYCCKELVTKTHGGED